LFYYSKLEGTSKPAAKCSSVEVHDFFRSTGLASVSNVADRISVWQVYQMLQIASEYIFRHSGGRHGGPQKGLECSEVTPNMWSL
jgi:hypothetical protein